MTHRACLTLFTPCGRPGRIEFLVDLWNKAGQEGSARCRYRLLEAGLADTRYCSGVPPELPEIGNSLIPQLDK